MTNPYLKAKACAFLYVFVLCLTTGCKDDVQPYTLRSSDDYFYYTINNSSAINRFSTIMYNREDTANPVERFKIVHISDPHLSEWSINNHYKHPVNLIESVTFANQQELRFNAMVETGDHISNAPKKMALEYLANFFYHLYANNHIPAFSCFGNHDPNMLNAQDPEYIPHNELSAAFNKQGNHPLKRTSASNSYYYADVPNPQGGSIRFIALDMTDQPAEEYNTLHWAHYPQEQIDWLGNVALKEGMTPQHSVILLTHYPFQISAWGGKGATVFSYLNNGDFVNRWNLVPEIIEAFRTRSHITKSFANRLDTAKATIHTDFDFTDATGEFVCYLGGHVHCFALFDIANTGSTFPAQKMILCTNQAPTEVGRVFNTVERRDNSIISNSFNIYAVDTNEKKVYITFFGAHIPSDDPSSPEILEFSYLNNALSPPIQ
jgi:predicted MPP superfamily phosphohydrolase